MPKMRKRKADRAATFPSAGSDWRIDPMSTGMPGTRLSARRGRNARTDRMALMLPNASGKMMGSQASVTTTKSSWHHASRRYECLCPMKPYAMIFIVSSKVKI